MNKDRLQKLAGILQLNEKMSTSNFRSMIKDMKRLLSQGKTITLVAKESHISDRFKGEIIDYKLTHENSKKLDEAQLNEATSPLDYVKLYDIRHKELFAQLSKDINDALKGKTILIHHLDSKDGHSWKDKEITVKKVVWGSYGDGPDFYATDGKTYNNHPDHKIRIVK